MEIPFEQVDWIENPESPFGFSAHGAQCDSRLHAKANQLINNPMLLDKVTLDSKDYSFDQNSWKCIVVGKSKANEDSEIVHYVLLVRSVPCAPQTYERVGVGALLADHISPATESIFVI